MLLYFNSGGTARGIADSFAALNPMHGFTSKDTMEKGMAFVKSLDGNEREKLKIAQRYYEDELALTSNIMEALRKKGVTEQQAKNLLKNYIRRIRRDFAPIQV